MLVIRQYEPDREAQLALLRLILRGDGTAQQPGSDTETRATPTQPQGGRQGDGSE